VRIEELAYWHWWVLGVALCALEVFAPGAVFIWFGVAALVVGLVVLLLPGIPWSAQIVAFAVLSVASLVAWRAWSRNRPERTDYPSLNRRAEQYVGRVLTLEEPIVNGHGKVRVDDSSWKIRGPDLPAGTRVRVDGVDGTLLVVSPVA
jgi:membrane protein implicated in regulation of membrane protease activity